MKRMGPCKKRPGRLALLLALAIGPAPGGCSGREASAPPLPPAEVTVITVEPRQVVLTTELPGRTVAYRVAEIRPQVNGLIQQRLFTEGSDVRAGQVLYRIDPAPFEAALHNTEASLHRAEATLTAVRLRAQRYRQLLAQRAVSQQVYDDADAALKQAEAEIAYWTAMVETARINLGYTRVTAPISGRIGRSSVTDGALVAAYQPLALATIQQLDPIYVDVPQSTTELLQLKRGLGEGGPEEDETRENKVQLILEDGTAYPLEGTLQFRDVSVDPATGSVILRTVFPNPDGVLLPGMFARVALREGVRPQGILVPQPSVARGPKGDPFVWIVDGQEKVQHRPVLLDRAIGDQWLVLSGLAPGDRVIVEGRQKVRPGAAVKALPFQQG